MQSAMSSLSSQRAASVPARKMSVNARMHSCLTASTSRIASPQPFVNAKTASLTGLAGVYASRAISCRSRASRSAAAVSVRAEISYIMIKPDGVQRGLVGEIISRFERKGFQLKALKLYATPEDVAKEHYKDLSSKPFYPALVSYITSGPVVSMVWEGKGVVASARKLIGATNPLASEPGTIRGDFAIEVGRNVIHGSDSPENGERETALWFPEGIVEWEPTMTPWLKE